MLRLYADECAHGAVIRALRERGVDVLTAQEDGREGAADPAVLDRATELGRVLFTQDDDLVVEATRRQRAAEPFAGVIYARQRRVSVSLCIEHLHLIALACQAVEFQDRIDFLPL